MISFASLKSRLAEFAQEFSSLKGAVFLFGKICLIAAVGFAYNIGTALATLEKQQLAAPELPATGGDGGDRSKTPLEGYAVIASRNIFGVKAKDGPIVPPTPVSKLSLRLVGTNTTDGTKRFAIIEDTTKKEQDVFEVEDAVFNQAKLLEVHSDQVKISHNGKTETLVLEDVIPSGDSGTSVEVGGDDKTEYTVAETELNEAMANLPVLLSQARAVPYFKNGQSVGMRLFAIRRESLYEKLGLKNGDILKAVNDNSLTDPSQALKIFEQLKSERSISVKIERNGAEQTLKYDIR